MKEEFKLNIPTMEELEEQMVGKRKEEKKQVTSEKQEKIDLTPVINRIKAIEKQLEVLRKDLEEL